MEMCINSEITNIILNVFQSIILLSIICRSSKGNKDQKLDLRWRVTALW